MDKKYVTINLQQSKNEDNLFIEKYYRLIFLVLS